MARLPRQRRLLGRALYALTWPLRLVLGIVGALATMYLVANGCIVRTREEEEREAERQRLEQAELVGDPEEEDDDRMRRWIQDMSPYNRMHMAEQAFLNDGAQVEPVVPFQEWLRERKQNRRR